MAKKGRLTDTAEARRDHLENAMFQLGGVLVDLDEAILRTQQAMRRTPWVLDVLDPAVVRLVKVGQQVRMAKAELNIFWTNEQEAKWRRDEGRSEN
jgi:phosphoglycolate phosphatase-like HAD superfamily hydrolase